MRFLNSLELKKILEFPAPVNGQISEDLFTMTLRSVHQIVGEAKLGPGENDTREARRVKRPSRRSAGENIGWWDLGQGAYWITFNEKVEVPPDCVLVIQPHKRILGNGVWHPAIFIRDWDKEMDGVLLIVSARGVKVSEDAVISCCFVVRLD